MNLQEFKNEFRFKYDSASSGAPDLNSYEMSLCLTQAAKDIVSAAYASYETNEISRRIIAPLLLDYNSVLSKSTDQMTNYRVYLATLPVNLNYVLREEVKLFGCGYNSKVESIDIDNLTESLNNPFKRPNSRKVIRVEYNKDSFKIYSELALEAFKIKYIKNQKPIILEDFDTDPELMGTETIEGLSSKTETELPNFIHDEIIDKAVIIAIKATRENSLQSQVQVK